MGHEALSDHIDLHKITALQYIEVRPGVMLQPLTVDDSAGVLAILEGDPEIRRRVTVAARLHNEQDIKQEIDAIENDPELMRYVVRLDGSPVGLISFWKDPGFFGQPIEPKGYGFGFFLDPNARGKGLVTDSVRALMSVAVKYLDIETFIAFCEDDNRTSRAVLDKLGMTPTDEVFGEPNNGWQERKYRFERNKHTGESEPQRIDSVRLVIRSRQNPDLFLVVEEADDRGNWKLPGGKFEKGENPLKAMQREAREEVELLLEDDELSNRAELTNNDGISKRFIFTVIVDESAVSLQPTESDDPERITGRLWVSKEDVLRSGWKNTQHILAAVDAADELSTD